MIIGLTGGIGSGKSTVAEYFRELGVLVIDSDQITRQLLAPNRALLTTVVEHFGDSIIDKEGKLDRAKLRKLIFDSSKERVWLEQLLHPFVKQEIVSKAAQLPIGAYLIAEIPLLIEAKFQDIVDHILVVDCDEGTQLERLTKRDKLSKEAIQAIMATQAKRHDRLNAAHEIIDNTSDLESLKKRVEELHHYYIELSK